MKRLGFLSLGLAGMILAILTFSSCSEDDPPPVPTVRLLAEVDANDGHKVNLTVEATDATSYLWEYGDDETSTTSGSHSYTYEYSGEYTIKVTVEGEGGTANTSESVVIEPEPVEILAGTPETHPNGKTWVLDGKYYAGKNGAGPITSDLPITLDFLQDNVLDWLLDIGEEYDNEFTFKYDNTFNIDNVNGISLAGLLSTYVLPPAAGPAAGYEGGQGLCGVAYTPANDGATWSLTQEDISLDAILEDPNDLGAGWTDPEEDVVLSNKWHLVTNGEFFALKDITNTVVIEELTSELMHIVLFMHGTQDVPMKPTTAIHVTMIPKN